MTELRIVDERLLADDWGRLTKVTFDYRRRDGRWQRQVRETYHRGDGVALLLYNAGRRTVVLTRQFRLPAYVNGSPDGWLVEVCAGKLDGDDPAEGVRQEAAEETGFAPRALHKVFEAYMSPGSVTEKLHFYVAAYDAADRVHPGGGDFDEGEDIEVLELPFDDALAMIRRGEIADGKTIMLLQHAALVGLENLSPPASPAAA